MAAYFYTRKKTREMQCHEFLCLCLEIPSVINLKNGNIVNHFSSLKYTAQYCETWKTSFLGVRL